MTPSKPTRLALAPTRLLGAVLVLLAALSGSSCQGLGKQIRDLNLYSEAEDVQLGAAAFQDVTGTEPILTSGPEVAQVRRVTDRLVGSARELMPGIADRFEWEVVVIDRPDVVNAFCLPGGKMAVYTGILPVAETDAGLAVVMGHEIAHATERHGTERLTRNGLLGGAIDVLLENEDHQAVAEIVANLGIGLPWGREDELEADLVGLRILANAGYDPREAARFWERMSAATGGGDPSAIEEFLSTHPSNRTRIRQLEEAVPGVLPLYESAAGKQP
jgi:predicted Zn-dependent protease